MLVKFESIPIGTIFSNENSEFKKISNEYPTVVEFHTGTAKMNAVTTDDDAFEVSFYAIDLVEVP